jgi:hypothetical protein
VVFLKCILYWRYRRLHDLSTILLYELAFRGRVVDRISPKKVIAREWLQAGAHSLLSRVDTFNVECK